MWKDKFSCLKISKKISEREIIVQPKYLVKKEEYKNKYPAIACIYTRCLRKKKQATLFLLRPCVLSLPSPDTLHCVVSKQPYCEQL